MQALVYIIMRELSKARCFIVDPTLELLKNYFGPHSEPIHRSTDCLSRISDCMIRLYQNFCRYTEPFMKISDHFHSQRAFAVKYL